MVYRLAAWVLAAALSVAPGQDSADSKYRASIEQWRAQHEADLRAEDGWLTVVGLGWLKAGPNRAGSAAGMEIRLPASAPRELGVFRLTDGRVMFEPAPGVAVKVNGKPASKRLLRADLDEVTAGSLTLFVIERGDRIGIRIKDANSEARRKFQGEMWYPVRASWRVVARFERYEPPRMIPVLNVLGQVQRQPCPGAAIFSIDGKQFRLDSIAEGNHLFFIFKDATSGSGTYPAGRFLYAPLPQDGRVILDFNKAESPPCAFTEFATCPLPPRQNQLPIRVVAGERYIKATHTG